MESTNKGPHETTSDRTNAADFVETLAAYSWALTVGGATAAQARKDAAAIVQRFRDRGDQKTADIAEAGFARADATIGKIKLANAPAKGRPC